MTFYKVASAEHEILMRLEGGGGAEELSSRQLPGGGDSGPPGQGGMC